MLEKFYTHICNIGKHVQNANEGNSSHRCQFEFPRTKPLDLVVWSPDFTENLTSCQKAPQWSQKSTYIICLVPTTISKYNVQISRRKAAGASWS